ncbi:MAG: hypothetical protein ACTSPM_11345 [Candidatus Heimdallarchaeota archaeon]
MNNIGFSKVIYFESVFFAFVFVDFFVEDFVADLALVVFLDDFLAAGFFVDVFLGFCLLLRCSFNTWYTH